MAVPRIGRPLLPVPAGSAEAPAATRRNLRPPQRKAAASVESPGGSNRRPRTGLRALKSRLFLRGLAVVDQRTGAARAYLATRRNLLEQLGGAEACSEAQLQLVELVARGLLYLGHVDALLLERRSLLNRRRSKLLPLVAERMRMSEILSRQLIAVGLEKRKAPVPSLEAWVAAARPAPGEAAP